MFVVFCQDSASCQFLNKIKVGVSYAWLTFENQTDPWRESTFQVDAGISVSKSIYWGLHYVVIDSWYADGPKQHTDAFQYGTYLEYYPVLPWGIKPYFVVSYDRGNYCTCEDLKSFEREGLQYVSIGGGVRYNLFQSKIHINVEFTGSRILNKIDRKYMYNRPTLGLDFLF